MFQIFKCFCPQIKELLMIKKCKQALLSANDAKNYACQTLKPTELTWLAELDSQN